MKLAKAHLDLGLYTNNKDAMLDFWQRKIGLPYDHLGKLGGGIHQHRHFLGDGPDGPILKINHARDPLENSPSSGISTLLLAREGLSSPRSLSDPEGNQVRLIPVGYLGITDTAIEIKTPDLDQFRKFYGEILDLTPLAVENSLAFQCGKTVILGREDKNQPLSGHHVASGYRYLTVQIQNADQEHAHILVEGGMEGMAPKTLGTTVRYSFVRDFDGNWLELSQRASLTGDTFS